MAIDVYFNVWRPLAFCLALMGASIANMCFPWINRSLIEHYGWRGALIVTSGFAAQMSIAGMLLRPEPKSDVKSEYDSKKDNRDSFINQTRMLFTTPNYVLFLISNVLFLFNTGIVITHIVAYVESQGFSSNQSNTVVTTMGGAMLGRSRQS